MTINPKRHHTLDAKIASEERGATSGPVFGSVMIELGDILRVNENCLCTNDILRRLTSVEVFSVLSASAASPRYSSSPPPSSILFYNRNLVVLAKLY